jgi:hypothetical protein
MMGDRSLSRTRTGIGYMDILRVEVGGVEFATAKRALNGLGTSMNVADV